jgi:ribosome biogenesis GTPase
MGKWEDYDDDDLDQFEKFQKVRRKKSRQKVTDQNDPFELGEADWANVKETGTFAARVVEVHKRYAFISPEPNMGEIMTRDVQLATIARKYLTTNRNERNFIVVGDRVLCRAATEKERDSTSELPQAVILNLAPRKSAIARMDPASPDRQHVLASNMHQLIFVASYLNPPIKWGLIDRYLVLAELQELPVTIIMNKEDLLPEAGEEFQKECQEKVEYFRSLGYTVLSVKANVKSPRKNAQLMQLSELLAGKISLVSGHSGVGKSSLLNLYKPEIIQDIEPDDNIFYKGRHTTSYASLIKLGTGGYMIDTPGIRSFCFEEKSSIDLTYSFRDFRPFLGKCKFRECRHVDEPECTVMAAVESGQIPEWRYRSFLAIFSGASGREGRIRDISL